MELDGQMGARHLVRARGGNKALHPLLVIAVFVVAFLEIHPFQDGNGRLSCVLTTLLLLRAGYTYVPFSSLESVIERNKEGYYLARRRTQGTIRTAQPDWTPWLTFFLRALQQQKRTLERKIERENVLLGDLPELAVRILDMARERGRVTIAEAVKATGTSRNTIMDHVRALTEQRHLTRRGAGRGVVFAWLSRRSCSPTGGQPWTARTGWRLRVEG